MGKRNRAYLEQVTREDILQFLDHLRDEEGNGAVTIRKQYETIKRLYKREKIAWPMLPEDTPRHTKKRVTAYKERELRTLFETATLEECELFQFFLLTGGREQEVMYATWNDIDFDDGLFLIQKKEHGEKEDRQTWDPKDREEAGIPIPDSPVQLLRERRERYPASRWIFPAASGEPEGHFLRKLKALALRAGLNCGECVSSDEGRHVCCGQQPVCRKWTLHKFRRTFATMHHMAGVPVRTIQLWLRHSDIQTTMLYIAAGEGTDRGMRQKVNTTFARLAPAPAERARAQAS